MEAVKLESLPGGPGSVAAVNNLQIAQETLGAVLVVTCHAPSPSPGPGHSERSGSGESARAAAGAQLRRETRAALSLGFLMGAFLVCWLPFFIWMPLVTVMVSAVLVSSCRQDQDFRYVIFNMPVM